VWAAATALLQRPPTVSCCVQAGVLLLLLLLLLQSPLVIRAPSRHPGYDVRSHRSLDVGDRFHFPPRGAVANRSTVDTLGPFLDDVTCNVDWRIIVAI